MPKFKVMIAQFPGNNITRVEVGNWVTRTVVEMCADPQIGKDNILLWDKADTPITMTRNECLLMAEREQVDYVLMLDNDVHPDCISPKEGAKPFWRSSWEFVRQHEGPCIVAAPYCGPPPTESVYIFRWMTQQSNNANPDINLGMYDRPHAAQMRGIQKAGALPTGVMLIDMRAVKKLDEAKTAKRKRRYLTYCKAKGVEPDQKVLDRILPGPRMYYEWKDEGPKCQCCGQAQPGPQAFKASTEDVTFSRDMLYSGVPIYCNWDAWAGHYKTKLVGPPVMAGPDVIGDMFREWGEELPPLQAHFEPDELRIKMQIEEAKQASNPSQGWLVRN